MSVIGIDPGASGALARYDGKSLEITDLPTWYQIVNKKSRKRFDAVGILDYFEMQKMLGAELVLIEQVGARPQQSGMFQFGYGVGLIYMACIAVRLPIESIAPQTWKKVMRVPGKKSKKKKKDEFDVSQFADVEVTKKELDGAIIGRADELFPHSVQDWRGPRGGFRVDRAEAAMLAKYAYDFALRSTAFANVKDVEWRLAYQNLATGA